jgi:hypothetical protein
MADTAILTSLHGKRFGLDRSNNPVIDRGDVVGPSILSSTAYTNVAAATALTASSTETLFSTSYTIPARTLVPGQLIKISYWGIVTASNASDTFASVLRIGGLAGTALYTHTATDATNNDIFLGEYSLIVRTVGASGTIVGWGWGKNVPAVEATTAVRTDVLASTTIDTTVDQVIGVTGQFSSTNAGNSARLDFISVELA